MRIPGFLLATAVMTIALVDFAFAQRGYTCTSYRVGNNTYTTCR